MTTRNSLSTSRESDSHHQNNRIHALSLPLFPPPPLSLSLSPMGSQNTARGCPTTVIANGRSFCVKRSKARGYHCSRQLICRGPAASAAAAEEKEDDMPVDGAPDILLDDAVSVESAARPRGIAGKRVRCPGAGNTEKAHDSALKYKATTAVEAKDQHLDGIVLDTEVDSRDDRIG